MNYIKAISRYHLLVLTREGICKFSYASDQIIELNDIVKKGICPYLYNNLALYISILARGGHFKWRKISNTVEVLCPNPSGLVNVLLTKSDLGIIGEVTSVGKECIFGYKKGDKIPQIHKTVICPYAFIAIFPDLLKCVLGNAIDISVRCPSCVGNVLFKIEKKEELKDTGE